MIIGAIKEHNKSETRCVLTPNIVKELSQLGHKILLQEDIGLNSSFNNIEYIKAGASLHKSSNPIYNQSQILLQITPPKPQTFNLLKETQLLISDFSSFDFTLVTSKPQILMLEKVPRTSVAQSIDILSSQHTIRGYIGAMYALYHSKRIAPQLITASTSIKSTSALVIGASITGLQATSIFKKQGCKVTILDIDEKNKELAQSVGANFIITKSEHELINLIENQNFIFASAGNLNNSPKIIHKHLLKYLKSAPILVDTTKNNIEISKNNKKTNAYIFHRNLNFETLAPITASELWANNMLNLLNLIISPDNQLDLSTDYISTMLYKG